MLGAKGQEVENTLKSTAYSQSYMKISETFITGFDLCKRCIFIKLLKELNRDFDSGQQTINSLDCAS